MNQKIFGHNGKNTRRFWLLAVFCMLFPVVAAAQDVKIDVRAPLMVAQGEQFRIEYVVTSTKSDLNQSQFIAPAFQDGVTVLSGPVKAFGVSFSYNDATGAREVVTNTYTYWVRADAQGKMKISAALVQEGGKKYSSNALVVDVVSAEQARANANRGAAPGGQPAAQGTRVRVEPNDILLRMEVNRTEVYKGEPLVASLKIYTQIGISGFQGSKYPALNGFWAQTLDVSGQPERRETVNGRVYQSYIIRQWLLYPQRTGTLEIEQAELTAVAQLVTERVPATDSPFDLFFGGGMDVQEVPTKFTTQPVKIRVKELPQPYPEGFLGAVGKFQLTGSATGDRFAANSAGSITIKLSGTGSFALIEAPKIELPAAFEQYDVKIDEKLNQTATGTAGERTYEYPFIARAEGSYVIPGVQFSYFDPSTGKYVTLRTGDFPIEILRDDGSVSTSGLGMVSGVTKEDLKMLGEDIRFIRVGDSGLSHTGRAFLWSWGWFASLLVLFGLFFGMLVFFKKRIRERADLTKVKTKKANKVALRRLKKAKVYMLTMKEAEFFEEMLKALWGYMGDKLAIDVANLTKEKVRHELELRGIGDEQIDEFIDLVSECEFAQYSPAVGIQMERAYGAALDLIGRFESKI